MISMIHVYLCAYRLHPSRRVAVYTSLTALFVIDTAVCLQLKLSCVCCSATHCPTHPSTTHRRPWNQVRASSSCCECSADQQRVCCSCHVARRRSCSTRLPVSAVSCLNWPALQHCACRTSNPPAPQLHPLEAVRLCHRSQHGRQRGHQVLLYRRGVFVFFGRQRCCR
jgi:hypothetical protein